MNQESKPPSDLATEVLGGIASHAQAKAVDQDGQATSYEELGHLAFRVAGTIAEVAATPAPRVLLALPSGRSAYVHQVSKFFE